jgi:hypothetical protein
MNLTSLQRPIPGLPSDQLLVSIQHAHLGEREAKMVAQCDHSTIYEQARKP